MKRFVIYTGIALYCGLRAFQEGKHILKRPLEELRYDDTKFIKKEFGKRLL